MNEQSGAVSGRVLQDEWFRDDDDDDVDNVDRVPVQRTYYAISDGCTPTVNRGAVENAARRRTRERERESGLSYRR